MVTFVLSIFAMATAGSFPIATAMPGAWRSGIVLLSQSRKLAFSPKYHGREKQGFACLVPVGTRRGSCVFTLPSEGILSPIVVVGSQVVAATTVGHLVIIAFIHVGRSSREARPCRPRRRFWKIAVAKQKLFPQAAGVGR
jgi:hypothetical protein